MNKNITKYIFSTLFLLSICVSAFAQPDDDKFPENIKPVHDNVIVVFSHDNNAQSVTSTNIPLAYGVDDEVYGTNSSIEIVSSNFEDLNSHTGLEEGPNTLTLYDGDVFENELIAYDSEIAKEELLERVSLYPNPASKYVTIEFPVVVETKLKVISLIGQTIFEKSVYGEGELRLDVLDFNDGIYLVEINSNEEKITKRIQIAH